MSAASVYMTLSYFFGSAVSGYMTLSYFFEQAVLGYMTMSCFSVSVFLFDFVSFILILGGALPILYLPVNRG